MKLNKKFFSKEVILFDQNLKTQDEIFETLNQELLSKDIVNDSFLGAIQEREKKFPTGLKLESGFGVAIPHTDPEFIKENQIGFMSLRSPVQFRQMGSDTEKVEVNMVFMLCLKEAHQQLDMLQNLMTLFGDDAKIKKLYASRSSKEFLSLIC